MLQSNPELKSKIDQLWQKFWSGGISNPLTAIEQITHLLFNEFKHMQAEDMLQHVQGRVFPFLRDLNGTESKFTYHMRNAVFIIPKPALFLAGLPVLTRDVRRYAGYFPTVRLIAPETN
jgi:type I restriction enzyme M protein